MYDHRLEFASQIFEAGMTLPVSTSAVASAAMRAGGAEGRLAICVKAADANVVMAIAKKLTLSITECDTETGSFIAAPYDVQAVRTLAAALAAEQGEELINLIVPRHAKKWIKVTVATDDAAAAGLIDVFLEYLAN